MFKIIDCIKKLLNSFLAFKEFSFLRFDSGPAQREFRCDPADLIDGVAVIQSRPQAERPLRRQLSSFIKFKICLGVRIAEQSRIGSTGLLHIPFTLFGNKINGGLKHLCRSTVSSQNSLGGNGKRESFRISMQRAGKGIFHPRTRFAVPPEIIPDTALVGSGGNTLPHFPHRSSGIGCHGRKCTQVVIDGILIELMVLLENGKRLFFSFDFTSGDSSLIDAGDFL